MQECKSNSTKEPIGHKGWYVTVQKDINTWGTREMGVKDGFFIIGIIGVIFMFFSPFIRGFIYIFNDIFGKSVLAWAILGILIILMIFFALKKVRKTINLANAVEGRTALKKVVKIVDFEYFTSDDNSGYYIILSDGEKRYKSSYHKGAKIFGKEGEELKRNKFKGKKQNLEQFHLHSQKGDFYIGDEYIILMDPDDFSNYTFESNKI